MKRQPDGRFRGNRQAVIVRADFLRARWMEAEIVRLKTLGFSYQQIAERIGLIACGLAPAMVPVPDEVSFPPNFSITKQAVHKAFTKALSREPTLAVEDFRKLDNARTEDMLVHLQPGIQKGNTRSIEVGVKILDHTAKINGYARPERHELTGKDGARLTLVQLLEAVDDEGEED